MLVHVKEIIHSSYYFGDNHVDLLETEQTNKILNVTESKFYVLKYEGVSRFQKSVAKPTEVYQGSLEECKHKMKEWINDIL